MRDEDETREGKTRRTKARMVISNVVQRIMMICDEEETSRR